jgi:small-conductance mechanosensitive channel
MAFFQIDFLNNIPGGAPAVFLVLLVALTIIFHVALAIIVKIISMATKKTKNTLDDRVLNRVSGYLPIFAFLTALAISLNSVYPEFQLGELTEWDVYLIMLVGVFAFALSSIIDIILVWYGQEIQTTRHRLSEKETFPFVRNVVKALIFAVFLTFALQLAGIETTALITGLGIGGIAVALALQDTLTNFFAGVHLLIDKPFREGDYIKLENGMEGHVRRIGWRTTKMRTWRNNDIYLPNSKIANATFENFSPTKKIYSELYSLGVGVNEDIDKVEKIILNVLRSIAKKHELMVEGSEWARFDSFGEFSSDFKYGYQVKGYTNRFTVLKDVQRELFYTLKKKKVDVPYPTRVVLRK